MQKFLVLAGALLLWCCGPPQPASIFTSPSGYAGPTGHIVGSVGIFIEGEERSPHYQNRLFFRSMDGTTTGEIAYTQRDLTTQETHYGTSAETGSVFALELPQGEYEFYNVKFYHNDHDSGGSWSYWSRQDFSLPFSVVSDGVSYLGSFVAHGAWEPGSYPYPLPAGGYFTVSDQFVRDKMIVVRVRPDIPADSIENRVLEGIAPPFVVR